MVLPDTSSHHSYRHLIEKYQRCTSSEDVVQTQETILADLEKSYQESREPHGAPVCLQLVRLHAHMSFVDNEDDWLAPNPNRRTEDNEGEASGEDSDPET